MPRARRLPSPALRALSLLVLILAGGAAVGATARFGRAPAIPRLGRTAATSSTLRIWYGTDDPTEQAWVQQLAQGFMARYRSVRVTLTTYGLDDLNNKMQLALGSGAPPDLVYATPRGPGLPVYVRAGRLLDLSGTARQRDWAGQLRPGLLASYNTLLAANGGSRDAGHIYAVPYDLAAVAVLYNKSIFTRLHLPIPRTLAALEALLPRLVKNGYTPLGLGNADGWVGDDWYLTLVNAGVDPTTLAAALRLSSSFSFEGAPYRAAASTLQRWAGQGYFTHDFGGLDAQDSVTTFFAGKTAMQLISSTENSQILALARQSRLDAGVFAFPSARGGRPAVMPQSGYAGWAIPRAAHNASAALDFISYAISAPVADLLLSHGLLPARQIDTRTARLAAGFQRDYLDALNAATPGVYLDSAPIPNINATMEANVELLLQNLETPTFLTRSLQQVYASRGAKATSTRTDGEF